MRLALVYRTSRWLQTRFAMIKRVLIWSWFVSKCLVGVALCGALIWGAVTAYRLVRDAEYFRLRDIRIVGHRGLTHDDVLYLLALPAGITLLQIDLPSAAARLARHPYVKHVTLRRRFPDGLTVTMQERQPHLIVASAGQHMVVDTEGVVLRPSMPRRDRRLPQLTLSRKRALTPGMRLRQPDVQRALQLVTAYHASPVAQALRLVSLTVDASGTSMWRIKPFDFPLRVGGDDIASQLERLPPVLQYIKQQALPVRLVDVSFRHRVIVKLITS